MANYTKNYNLIKPTKNEQYDIEDVTNTNMDIIDAELINCIKKDGNKVLSQNDFTDEYKKKVDEIKNVSGLEGATFMPSVSEEGILSWTNNKGLNNPEAINIMGKSAYELATENGYIGTIEEWLKSLNGKDGRKIIIYQGIFNINSNGTTNDLNVPVSEIGDINIDDLVIGFAESSNKDKNYLCIYKVLNKHSDNRYAYIRCQKYIDITPQAGKDGEPGEKGKDGQPGADGKDGADGYTPQKGVDYFTEAEKTEMTNTVINRVNEEIGLILDEINGEVI